MERRVSWSDPLIQPSELHKPPDEQLGPRGPDEDTTPSSTAASKDVAEVPSPEAASPESALPVMAGGERKERLGPEVVSPGSHVKSPSFPEPLPLPAPVPYSSSSRNIEAYAGTAIVMVAFMVSMLAFIFADHASAQKRRISTGEVRILSDEARHLPPTMTTSKPTPAARAEELVNTTLTPTAVADTHRERMIREAHSDRPKSITRWRGRRQRGKYDTDGHPFSGVKGQTVAGGRSFVPVTPLHAEYRDYQQVDA